MTQQTPPGWYPDPSGVPGQRYWDGQQWGPMAPTPTPQKSHTGRNALLIIGGVLGAILLIGVVAGLGNDEKPAPTSGPQTSRAPSAGAPSSALPEPASPTPTTTAAKQITYEVHSDGPLSSVSYYDDMNNMTQVTDQPADWSVSFTGKATYQLHSMSAQTTGEQVSCQITVNGTVVASETATGRYAVVVCSGA